MSIKKNLSRKYHQYREHRKWVLVNSNNFYPTCDPNEIGDDFGNHKEWTTDQILNLFDTGYRWALEDIKKEIHSLVEESQATGNIKSLVDELKSLLEKNIEMTFYDGKEIGIATDERKIKERKITFNKLREHLTSK